MYRPEIKRKRSGAPVLSRKEIDVIGQNIVGDFMPEALKSPQEIDIDLLAQDYLGMDQDETLVFGHTHEPFALENGAINTGSWKKSPCTEYRYLEIDGGSANLKSFS